MISRVFFPLPCYIFAIGIENEMLFYDLWNTKNGVIISTKAMIIQYIMGDLITLLFFFNIISF